MTSSDSFASGTDASRPRRRKDGWVEVGDKRLFWAAVRESQRIKITVIDPGREEHDVERVADEIVKSIQGHMWKIDFKKKTSVPGNDARSKTGIYIRGIQRMPEERDRSVDANESHGHVIVLHVEVLFES